jgi:purine-nucleoside phosphorylase
MVAALGGDLVGMSTVPEIIAGAQLGLRMAAVGVVSNLGAGLADEHLTHEDVTRVVGGAADRIGAVFVRAMPGLLRA